MENRINHIIARVLSGESTSDDILSLSEWLNESETNRDEFRRLKNYWDADVAFKHSVTPALFSPKNDNSKYYFCQKSTKKLSFVWKAAIAAIFLLTSICSIYLIRSSEDPLLVAAKEIQPTEKKHIELTLAHGETIPILHDSANIQYMPQNNHICINNQTIKKKISHPKKPSNLNHLTVPIGKRSILTLSDNTRVWINAGTHVIYPEVFSDNKREIYVDGEVYLEVSPDKNRPFIVKTVDMQINVLGTSFNVMAYKNESTQSIVLVKGSVQIENEALGTHTLKPHEMFIKKQNQIKIEEVDVDYFISWKDGIFQFQNETIKNILQRIAKYYGITIKVDSEISNLTCSGKLCLTNNLTKQLEGLTSTAPISYYEVNGIYYFTNKKE